MLQLIELNKDLFLSYHNEIKTYILTFQGYIRPFNWINDTDCNLLSEYSQCSTVDFVK